MTTGNSQPDRTTFLDSDGNSYSKEVPHAYKRMPLSQLCYCQLELEDPIHDEGVALPEAFDIEAVEFEEYQPPPHFYFHSTDGLCALCRKDVNSSNHLYRPSDQLSDQAATRSPTKQDYIDRYNEAAQNHEIRELREKSTHDLEDVLEVARNLFDAHPPRHQKNPHSFFTKGDKVVLGSASVILVANFVVGVLNIIHG